jgi:divalent metal cation (Fe/Co/Zn/Cd) transporter
MSFARFLWDFLVGDDWLAAAGVVVAIALTWLTGFWWLLPIAVALVLYVSLRRAIAPAG